MAEFTPEQLQKMTPLEVVKLTRVRVTRQRDRMLRAAPHSVREAAIDMYVTAEVLKRLDEEWGKFIEASSSVNNNSDSNDNEQQKGNNSSTTTSQGEGATTTTGQGEGASRT